MSQERSSTSHKKYYGAWHVAGIYVMDGEGKYRYVLMLY